MAVYALVSMFLILVGATGAVYGYRFFRSRAAAADDPIMHFNCPGCKRRLGYRARQAGHKGMCPRCRINLIFPVIPGKTPSSKSGTRSGSKSGISPPSKFGKTPPSKPPGNNPPSKRG